MTDKATNQEQETNELGQHFPEKPPAPQDQDEAPEGFALATLRSTYAFEGKEYGPGIDIWVPQTLADLVNVDLPIDQSGMDGEITLRAHHKQLNDDEDIKFVQGPGTAEEKRAAMKRAQEGEQPPGPKGGEGGESAGQGTEKGTTAAHKGTAKKGAAKKAGKKK